MKLIYQDASRSTAERAADLLARMTPEEKLQQMRTICPIESLLEGGSYSEEKLRALAGCGIGICYGTANLAPETLNRMQRFMLEQTRLGIPFIYASESIHGVMSDGATVFPQAIGLGSAWSTELMAEVAGVIGREARALGITQVFAPDLDLSREPRWGRVEENYGEDPWLTSRLGVEYVKALQAKGVAATLKHYAAHGSPEGGVNLGPVHLGERELRETMLPPFAACVREAGALSVMPAYSELDGVPLHASRFLLTDVLRGEWGFEGYTISDFGAVEMLHSFHRTARNALEAGRQALRAGLDLEAPNLFGYGEELAEAVRRGDVPQEWIDRAVGRILCVKFQLGLFENPYALADVVHAVHNETAVDLARRTALETPVLLKNEGGLLPLSGDIGTVAVIGPNARIPQLGDYTPREATGRSISLLQALTGRLGEGRVRYALGCTTAAGADDDIQKAVETARCADAVILALGDNSSSYGGIGWGDENASAAVTCGEGFDSASLTLPGRQQELLEAVAATGTPVVLVLMTGRPYCVGWAKEHVPAILQAWYAGEQGGTALADLIFGDANPSGKLPISFPQSAGHVPDFYNHKVSARGYYKNPGTPERPGQDYVFSSPEPLWPFGFGLSYTTFSYADLTVWPQSAGLAGPVEVSVKVRNTGSREGKEVVQLYLTDCYCCVTPFVRRLRGFRKINLKPGEGLIVKFTLDAKDFAFINEGMKEEIEPGEFTVEIGGLKAGFSIQ